MINFELQHLGLLAHLGSKVGFQFFPARYLRKLNQTG